jgi:hypothetical protein
VDADHVAFLVRGMGIRNDYLKTDGQWVSGFSSSTEPGAPSRPEDVRNRALCRVVLRAFREVFSGFPRMEALSRVWPAGAVRWYHGRDWLAYLVADEQGAGEGDAGRASAEARQRNEQAYRIIWSLVTRLKRFVIAGLKLTHGPGESGWWVKGVPESVRRKVEERRNQQGYAYPREDSFDIVDFRDIVRSSWPLFARVLEYGARSGKKRGTAWLDRVNEMRLAVMHPERGQVLTPEQLAELHEYDRWLEERTRAAGILGDSEGENPTHA